MDLSANTRIDYASLGAELSEQREAVRERYVAIALQERRGGLVDTERAQEMGVEFREAIEAVALGKDDLRVCKEAFFTALQEVSPRVSSALVMVAARAAERTLFMCSEMSPEERSFLNAVAINFTEIIAKRESDPNVAQPEQSIDTATRTLVRDLAATDARPVDGQEARLDRLVQFAEAGPPQFDVVFGAIIDEANDHPGLVVAAHELMGLFRDKLLVRLLPLGGEGSIDSSLNDAARAGIGYYAERNVEMAKYGAALGALTKAAIQGYGAYEQVLSLVAEVRPDLAPSGAPRTLTTEIKKQLIGQILRDNTES